MHLAAELLALCVYGPLLVLLHEVGHAWFARRGGYRVTSFGIGSGAPVLNGWFADGVVVYLGRWFFTGGACTAIPIGPPTARRAWFHAGGLIAQGAVAGALLLAPSSWLGDRIAVFNLLVALTNALPWRAGGQASDGWHILDALSGSVRAGHVIGQRPQLQRTRQQELAVDSPVGVAYCDVCLAWSEVQLGLLDAASDRITDEDPQLTREPWIGALYRVALAEWHRASGRPLAAIRVAREGRALDGLDGEGRALLDLVEARALVDAGAPEAARGALARLVGATGLVSHQAAATLLHASLDSATADLELAVWRVERHLGDGWLDAVDVILALRRAADALEQRGRALTAKGARRAATALLDRVESGVGLREQAWIRARLAPPARATATSGR